MLFTSGCSWLILQTTTENAPTKTLPLRAHSLSNYILCILSTNLSTNTKLQPPDV